MVQLIDWRPILICALLVFAANTAPGQERNENAKRQSEYLIFPWPLMVDQSAPKEVMELAKKANEKLKLAAVQVSERNPVCCLWVEITPGQPNPVIPGYLIMIHPGGGSVSATDVRQMELAFAHLTKLRREQDGRTALPLGVITNYSVIVAEAPADPSYDALLERVKKGDSSIDFAKLRMAFTATAAYAPYDADSARDEMDEALKNGEYSGAAALAEKVLKKNFLDIKAHLVAHRAYLRLKQEDKAMFHRTVYDRLIESILKSGDGKTTSTAYTVISVDEEYALLNFLDVESTQQGLLREEGQHFDQIVGLDKKNQKSVTLFFNISKPLSWALDRPKKGK